MPRRLTENCDSSEDGGKSSPVFRSFEANSGDYLTKMSGKLPGCRTIRFAAAAVGQSVLGQPPRLPDLLDSRCNQVFRG